MKKMMTYILITVLALIAFAIHKGSTLQNIEIVTSTTINGDKNDVFDMVKSLKKFPKWSPFLVQDPSQKYEFKGTDGTVGSQFHWIGNGGKDVGYQEITKIEEGRFIGKKCDIQKPFVAKPTFEYHFSENANGITVKETFKLESGLLDAVFLWIFGAKAQMITTNQLGLDLLKKAVEEKSLQ